MFLSPGVRGKYGEFSIIRIYMGALDHSNAPIAFIRGNIIMKHNVDVIALKLVHMMFCKGLIDRVVYHQILSRYA